MFSTLSGCSFIILVTFNLSSANAFNLDQFGEELINLTKLYCIYLACNIELDIIFDYAGWRLSGSQKAIEINELGTVNPGAMYKDMTSYKFDGNLYYRILYFKQAFPKLYANVSIGLTDNFLTFLRTKSITKKQTNKCMAKIKSRGGIRTRDSRTNSQ